MVLQLGSSVCSRTCINTASMHTISRSFIEYIDGPLGKLILRNVQSTLFLHKREVVPSSYFTFRHFEEKIS